MYIDDSTYTTNGRTHRRVLLRRSYWEDGKVKKGTVANLSHCSDEEIDAMKIGLKYKKNLKKLENLAKGKCVNGKTVGDVAALHRITSNLGIAKALGVSQNAKLIQWLAIARLIDQGSRLSAVRLARTCAACEILGLDSFNENDLYNALDWLCENQERIEEKLFKQRKKTNPDKPFSTLYLYDVSSSYVEGECNELAAWGYNRDGKKGKKQVVYGLLTDEDGDPISIEVFRGNTSDPKTVEAQIDKLKGRFACEHVALVGDKGMSRGSQIMAINKANFNYITGITKAEIRTLLKDEVLQMELFDVDVCEVTETRSGIRYILRRNPARAEEMARNRRSKIDAVEKKIAKTNLHLKEHSRAKATTQTKNLNIYVEKLKIDKYIAVFADDSTRTLSFRVDGEKMRDVAKLDGCYVIKTDLPKKAGDAKTIHKRYKDLALLEKSFQTMKKHVCPELVSGLEVRPIFVRKANRTKAHFFVAMLAYKIERYLRKSWADLDMTVGEGIRTLSTITGIVLTIGNQRIVRVPEPNSLCLQLLSRINVVLPEILPCKEVYLDTRKKLHQCREN